MQVFINFHTTPVERYQRTFKMMNHVLEQIRIHPVRSKTLERSEDDVREENIREGTDHESRCGANIENHLTKGIILAFSISHY